jgi:hypothetical protein
MQHQCATTLIDAVGMINSLQLVCFELINAGDAAEIIKADVVTQGCGHFNQLVGSDHQSCIPITGFVGDGPWEALFEQCGGSFYGILVNGRSVILRLVIENHFAHE